MPIETSYIDHENLGELVLLRRLADVHNRIRANQNQQMSPEQQAIDTYLRREMDQLIDDYNGFLVLDRQAFEEPIGVVIGRFQLPELHDGHRYIIDTVRKRHLNLGIGIGVADEMTAKDPLDYHMRAIMIQGEFPAAIVMAIRDIPGDDIGWSHQVDDTIRLAFPTGKVRLYGGRDSFVPFYHGKFPTTEITPVVSMSATQIRGQVGETPLSSLEFRKGIIFATQHKEQHGDTKRSND